MLPMRLLITGGAGFIGSALVRHLVSEGIEVINLDKLSYAGNLESLATVESNPHYCFEKADICDRQALARIFDQYTPEAVIHLAAESHVDRSIDGPEAFIQTNVIGTYYLLDAALTYWQGLNASDREKFRFLHVSTDEVYGSLGDTGLFTEDSPYRPNSPYSASKAASDHLARAWFHTYGLPVLTSNCSNNYGPYQFPEKLIPLIILNALESKPLPVYGTGENIRDWLYVDDHARALHQILLRGQPGETYNVGGHNEKSNIQVVRSLCRALDEKRPDSAPHERLVTFVPERPGHDQRYAIDPTKVDHEIGWRPEETFESGLSKTIDWYLENLEWCRHVQEGKYRRERLGTAGNTA